MSIGEKIPATIITGFLGAGKTTLVRNLIATAGGKRIALIVNEFGDMGFDGELLSDCRDPTCKADEIVELNNGCICCTVAEDFLPTMEALLKRDPAPDHIVIETSGLALPQPLVRAFQWPSVRNSVTVDGVVTVVDCAAVAAGQVAIDEVAVAQQRTEDEALDHESPIEELFEDQLRCADMIVLNKADLVNEGQFLTVTERVREDSRAGVSFLKAKNGLISAEVLLGLGAGAEADMDDRKSHHENQHDEGDDDHHHHHHDDFESVVLSPQPIGSPAAAKEKVAAIMALPGVLRVKGKLAITGKPAPLVVQAVGPRVETWFGGPGEIAAGLVVIGLHDFDRAEVDTILASTIAA
ncbi:MAG: cobalamin biosynthesis protein CobW [Stappiaceae bacterium]